MTVPMRCPAKQTNKNTAHHTARTRPQPLFFAPRVAEPGTRHVLERCSEKKKRTRPCQPSKRIPGISGTYFSAIYLKPIADNITQPSAGAASWSHHSPVMQCPSVIQLITRPMTQPSRLRCRLRRCAALTDKPQNPQHTE